MSCCCCGDEDDEEDDAPEGNPGPDVKRRCTNVFCLLLLVVCMSLQGALLQYIDVERGIQVLTHGHDHYRNICGIGSMRSKRYVYYPDLQNDFRSDPTLQKRYGVCVERCPEQGTMVDDYELTGTDGQDMRRAQWFVPLPSFNFSGRCIPYKPEPKKREVQLCAYPPCERIAKTQSPSAPREICGSEDDDPPTDDFWLLTKPDTTLIEAWRAHGVPEAVIEERIQQAGSTEESECEVIVERSMTIGMQPADDAFLMKVLTKYTGILFKWSKTVHKKRHIVIGLGIGGALVASFVVICALTCLARCVVLSLLFVLFFVLTVADYVLFQQAGIVDGSTGKMIISTFEDHTMIDIPDNFEAILEQGSDDEHIALACKWSGIVLAVLIPLLACGVCMFWKNFEKLIALLREASRTLREMPSLLLFPFLLVPCMVATSLFFMYVLLGLSTVDAADVKDLLPYYRELVGALGLLPDDDDGFTQARTVVMWLAVFGFLWAYFMHVAMFVSVVAFAVSHWYFYRDDPDRDAGTGVNSGNYFFGRPALLAIWRVCRYHLGSMAFGSFVMALATMPRIMLEYFVNQTGADQNAVGKAIACVVRCCLWCLQKCLEFLTEYAYVYVAVTGKPFCSAARASFALVAKYPLQVALDKMACTAIGYLTCVSVPVGMAVVAFYILADDWAACASFIVCLAYVTTRLTVGVYDICVTTLFVCVMRDSEHYGGRYAPDGLRIVCELHQVEGHAGGSAREVGVELSAVEQEAPPTWTPFAQKG